MILARQKASEVQISASGLAQSNHVNASFNWLCSFSSDRDNQFSLKGVLLPIKSIELEVGGVSVCAEPSERFRKA